jgi:diguanylate cyclase (GGDEF)-like protein
MKYKTTAQVLMSDKAIARMLIHVTASTFGTIAISLLVVAAAVRFGGVDPSWKIYALALVLPAILTPAFSIAYVRANYRLHQLQRELKKLANADPLTELLNRRAFFEQAADMFAVLDQKPQPVAAMMIDLDHFKMINDKSGHAAGDAVIQMVSRAIAKTVVSSASGHEPLVARFGGEEFVVLVVGMDPSDLERLAERIRETCRNLVYWLGRTPLTVTASIGLAVRANDESIDVMLQAADAALYEAKRAGRDRWYMAGRSPDFSAATLVPGATVTSIRTRKRTVDAA